MSKQTTPTGSDILAQIGPDIFKSFKDSQGRFRTLSLFREEKHDSYPAFFTLKPYDIDGYPSLYKKYMDIADPTEYQVAIQLFGSWAHWQQLASTKWFREYLDDWRKELQVKLDSQRYHEMVTNIADPKTTVAATKWLADRYGTGEDKASKRGRPSKEEVANNMKRLTREKQDTSEDAARIGLAPKVAAGASS